MVKFAEICMSVLVSGIFYQIALSIFSEKSKVQKYRFRKALDRILFDLTAKSEEGAKYPELSIIHKNRKFSIAATYEEINNRYGIYTVFINGQEAALYHRFKHDLLSSYYLEEVNKRHMREVISIVLAGDKVLRKLAKPVKEKRNGYSEYSYFN